MVVLSYFNIPQYKFVSNMVSKKSNLASPKHEHDVLPSIDNAHGSIKNSHPILNILMMHWDQISQSKMIVEVCLNIPSHDQCHMIPIYNPVLV
jgi:hypothetical protein